MAHVKTRRRRLAIYRLRNAVTGQSPFAKLIDDEGKVVTEKVASIDGEFEARLYVKSAKPDYPWWNEFLSSVVNDLESLLERHAANSAVLILTRKKLRYAVAFGHGGALLARPWIERGFGLRCALDLIDPDSVVSVGFKEVDHTTLFSNVQSNRDVRFDAFRVDTDATLLNGVVGKPAAKHRYYTKALGSDALHINPRIVAGELPKLLEWVEAVYQTKNYVKNGYDWIDYVGTVRDEKLIQQLSTKLDSAMADRRRKQPSIAAPEAIDYKLVDAFTVVGLRGARLDEISLEDIKRARNVGTLSVDVLKKAQIRSLDSDDKKVKGWPAFNWLTWSTKIGAMSYVLQDGVFYEIEPSYEKRIDTYLTRLDPLPAKWPDWQQKPKQTKEYFYNEMLAGKLGKGKAYLLDDVMFNKTFQGHGQIEFCDVFVPGKVSWLIAAKKYAGKSAPLSHLFAQGTNAADTLLGDEGFRKELRQHRGLQQHIPVAAPPHRALAALVSRM